MAPEQAGARSGTTAPGEQTSSGRATDIYALGAILYETLTGRPPFLAATVYETLRQVCNLDPVPPRQLQPQVPRDLETICLACLRKEPQRRYATALALADDLGRFLEGKTIQQRPPALWEPALKWARRRPAAAAWVVLGTVALFGLLVAGLYYFQHRQEWARRRALDRYEQICRRRDEALFQGTVLSAAHLAPEDRAMADLNAAQEAAREALSLAGVEVEGESAPVLDASLTAEEKADVTGSCYELLLVLSQAVGQPLPAASPEDKKQRAAAGLRILDHAARLGPPTRAFHLQRAHLLTQYGDSAQATDEQRKAEGLRPATASDWYLTGVGQ
jgi:hypothetical protein